MTTFDLAAFNTSRACEVGYELELESPFSTPENPEMTGLFVLHKGRDAQSVVAANRKNGNKILARDMKARRTGEDVAQTIEESNADTVEVVVAATIEWYTKENGVKTPGWPLGGERVMFSPEKATEIYSDPGFAWITRQINVSAGDLGNFKENTLPSLSPTPRNKERSTSE